MAFGANQFGVGAIFGDGSVFDDQDAVGPLDGGEAMGDDEAGMGIYFLPTYRQRPLSPK